MAAEADIDAEQEMLPTPAVNVTAIVWFLCYNAIVITLELFANSVYDQSTHWYIQFVPPTHSKTKQSQLK